MGTIFQRQHPADGLEDFPSPITPDARPVNECGVVRILKYKVYISHNYISIIILLILAGILGGTLGYLSTQPNERWIGIFVPIGQGIVGAIIFAYTAQRVEIKRLYYLAAFSIGIGLVIGALGVGIVLGVSFFYLCIGLALIVTGCVTLAQYLRSHEPVDLNGEIQ